MQNHRSLFFFLQIHTVYDAVFDAYYECNIGFAFERIHDRKMVEQSTGSTTVIK
jgi:hypothetical protein